MNVHVACVYDPPNTAMTLYVDGLTEAWGTGITIPLSSINNVYSWLGRSLFLWDPYINANIDEFRIYNFSLSYADVWQSYLQGPNAPLTWGRVGPAVNFGRDGAGLKLSWPDALSPWDPVWKAYSTTNLAPPISWALVTNAVVRTNGQVWLTLPLEAPRGFFRLQAP